MLGIPLVDISMLGTSDENILLQKVDHALAKFGFLNLCGHGLDSLYESYSSEMLNFFSADNDVKMSYHQNAGYGPTGYCPAGVESVARSTTDGVDSVPDPVESFVVQGRSDVLPHRANGYKSDILKNTHEELSKGLQALLSKFMQIMAKCMKMQDDQLIWNIGYKNGGSNALRTAHYLKSATSASTQDNNQSRILYGQHTDYTGFTFLWRNCTNGLQCLDASDRKSWIDVPLKSRHVLTVNAGDLIQRWTNGRWISNVHRVLETPANVHDGAEKLSIVFFTGPEDDVVVDPRDLYPRDDESCKMKYAPIKAGEWLKMKLTRTNVNE